MTFILRNTLSLSPSLTANLTLPAATDSSIRSADSSELVVISKPSALAVLKRRIRSSVWVCDSLSSIISTCWVPLKLRVGDSFPHVGPVKMVSVQSQTKRFHPSKHNPPLRHGWDGHCGGWMWHKVLIEPVIKTDFK